MIFKGLHFRKSRTVVTLPNFDYATGEKFPYVKDPNYVYFGRVLKDQSKADPKLHPKTSYYKSNDPERKFLHADPIEDNGHSLTNMMYGADGRVYLAKDGCVFTAVLPRRN